ncbi:hypothetical protein PACTADRAFT_3167 [Pachysolen tannophilus NRRL Y-2460]|uniref:Uncharacterized protein n=1 Tax=Pachysolen tannophilus NRRL Y-2460 TaxID=669874 RepID=A0A1E4TUY5_PACTA|nr:hypothetical protein PACTADRAFT_3167 [Pachysolen tannophilus NRRL Y-2460]
MSASDISIELIGKAWDSLDKNGDEGFIKGVQIYEFYQKLYSLLDDEDDKKLDAFKQFTKLKPNFKIYKKDVDYFHFKLIHKHIVDLVSEFEIRKDELKNKENENNIPTTPTTPAITTTTTTTTTNTTMNEAGNVEETDDNCQIIYSPHKKTPKVIPIYNDNKLDNSDVAGKLDFTNLTSKIKTPVSNNSTTEEEEDCTITKNIFKPPLDSSATTNGVVKTPNGKVLKSALKKNFNKNSTEQDEEQITHLKQELIEKDKRIKDLEKVLVELNNHISDLKIYNAKEIELLKKSYKKKLNSLDQKIDRFDLNSSAKEITPIDHYRIKTKLQRMAKDMFISIQSIFENYSKLLIILVLVILIISSILTNFRFNIYDSLLKWWQNDGISQMIISNMANFLKKKLNNTDNDKSNPLGVKKNIVNEIASEFNSLEF